MFAWLKVRYCRARMAAYLNHELPAAARRRVARLIDEDPACYAEYIRQRDLQRELTSRLPSFGQPQPDQLNRIWAAVQTEMVPDTAPRRMPHAPRTRYGLAGMAAALLIAVPYSLGAGGVALAEPNLLDNTPSRVALQQIAQSATPAHNDVIIATPTHEAAQITPKLQTAAPIASATPAAGPSGGF